MAARTAKQKAALRKAQLASARKRKRNALARNVGRGVVGSKRGSRKTRYRVARAVGAVALTAGVAAGAHYAGKHLAKRKVKASNYKTTYKKKASYGNRNPISGQTRYKQAEFKRKTAPRPGTGAPNRYNRVFATNKYGKTSVRKRGA